jgi:hypothetical protein
MRKRNSGLILFLVISCFFVLFFISNVFAQTPSEQWSEFVLNKYKPGEDSKEYGFAWYTVQKGAGGSSGVVTELVGNSSITVSNPVNSGGDESGERYHVSGASSLEKVKVGDGVVGRKIKGFKRCKVSINEVAIGSKTVPSPVGYDCRDMSSSPPIFTWSQDFGTPTETKIRKKNSEKVIPLDLEVEDDKERWGTQFEVIPAQFTSDYGSIEEKFIKLEQKKWENPNDPTGPEDYKGLAQLEINIESLGVGRYAVLARAFKLDGNNIRTNVEEKGIFFVIIKEDVVVGGAPVDTTVKNTFPETGSLSNLQVDSIPKLIGSIIRTAMGILGSIAFAMFVYGGFLWLTAMGNAEKTKKATQILIWTTLGIIVIISSWTILTFIFGAFS